MGIFIQIASYRDPQLIPTIKDMVAQAHKPEELKICIHNQFHEADAFNKDIDEYRSDQRFIIIDTPCLESKGACWARNKIQQYYNAEEYTLQLDSHHRFVKDWDKECIDLIQELQEDGYKKPLLTGYIPSYDPKDDPGKRVQEPWRMSFDRFIPEGAVFFLPETIPQWEQLLKPVPSRFYSAHFCFTLGSFATEVQHDPEFYFHGEEISIAVRAFTHGYDLFHPHKIIAWHEYTREGRTKQWDDDKQWVSKNDFCHLKNRKLFSMDGLTYNEGEFGIYGFGKERSLRDYEKYAGLSFSKRAVQKETLDKHYPRNTLIENETDWENSFSRVFKHYIDVHKSQLAETDYEFVVVAFHNDNGDTLSRKDADINEINSWSETKGEFVNILREFITVEQPTNWVVWGHSKSKGWCDKITGNLKP